MKDRIQNSFFGRSIFLNILFVFEGGASFIVDMVIAASLGLGGLSDGLYAAWILPQAIGRGMFQGLTNSFMGLFAGENNPESAYNQSITVILALAIPLAALFSLTSFLWLPITIPGASQETVEIAIPLAAILSWLIGFLAMTETFRAIYYKENKVYGPSVARLVGALATIIIVLYASANENLQWVAWGILIGVALETLLSFIGLRWLLNLHYRFSWPESDRLRDMRSMIGMPLAGQTIRILAGIGERALASTLAPGSLTAVTYTNRIINTVERFAFRGFVIATIQTYSSKIQADLSARFRQVVLVALPTTIIFAVLSEPLVATLFGRGRFTDQDVIILAIMLQTYALAVIAIAITRIPFGLAYAKKQSRVILGYFIVVSTVLILAEIALLYFGFDLRSFGIAYTLSTAAAFIWLYLTVLRPDGTKVMDRKDILQLSGVGIFSGVATVVAVEIFPNAWPSWLILAAGTVVCLVTLIVAAKIFKIPEFQGIRQILRRVQG